MGRVASGVLRPPALFFETRNFAHSVADAQLTEENMRIAILIAALLVPTLALADGQEGSTKDGWDSQPPRTALSYSYAYGVRQSRGGWECPPEFSRRECRRIEAEAGRRRAREVRRAQPRKQIVYVDRRAADTYGDRPAPRSFGGKKCAGYFTVKGDARPFERLARGSALKEWRKHVRTSAGESYIDENYSPNFQVGKCQIVGDRGINKRCVAEGIACRP